jgi:AhpC/TSA family
MLTAFAIATVIASGAPIEAGTQLTYTGTLVPTKDDGNPATKKFDVSYVVLDGEGGAALGWVLSETGRGTWMWLDHFGMPSAGAKANAETGGGPALLYEREDGKSIVPLPEPLWPDSDRTFERGAAWSDGRLDYRVTGQAMKAGRMCWEIEARSPYGHKRNLWIEQGSPLVVAVRETVFMGQGQEHKLTLELAESKVLSADELAKTAAAFGGWSKLRETLGWKTRDTRTELTDQQIATLKTELPKLLEGGAESLKTIAVAAQRDAQGQKNRAGAVAALREAIVGQPLGNLKLEELAGKAISHSDLAGKVVVLHFWEYRDSPLEEPYGQTGYLDYLARRRAEAGVVVYGVHVDPRLGDETTRRAAANSARKLKAFMNLNYPILLDEGGLLKRLGDPRPAGGKLPLFVVVGKDGKVAEYRAGMYDVKANEGLVELDTVIAKLLTAN